MATWKVFVVFLFGCATLALTIWTLILGISVNDVGGSGAWFGGALAGTLFVGFLFFLFLRSADKSYPTR